MLRNIRGFRKPAHFERNGQVFDDGFLNLRSLISYSRGLGKPAHFERNGQVLADGLSNYPH